MATRTAERGERRSGWDGLSWVDFPDLVEVLWWLPRLIGMLLRLAWEALPWT